MMIVSVSLRLMCVHCRKEITYNYPTLDDDDRMFGVRDLLVSDSHLLHRRQHSADIWRVQGSTRDSRQLHDGVAVLPVHLHESVHLRRQARSSEEETS